MKVRALLMCCWLALAGTAGAVTLDEYKSAFNDKRYSEVVKSAPEILKQSPTAANHYRLAFAAAKLNDWAPAAAAIAKAESLDPSLSFVATKEEFGDLKRLVEKNLSAQTAPQSTLSADVVKNETPARTNPNSGNADSQIPVFLIISLIIGFAFCLITHIITKKAVEKRYLKAEIDYQSTDFDVALDRFHQITQNFYGRLIHWAQDDSVLAWRLRALIASIEEETDRQKTAVIDDPLVIPPEHEPLKVDLVRMDPVLGHHDAQQLHERVTATALKAVLSREGWACEVNLDAQEKGLAPVQPAAC